MMEKQWLIRTRNKKLLGPVSKSKILELLEKGSLTGDDELCMGNGYWFWVREKNLVERYLYGPHDQPFNPVSEAASVDFDLAEFGAISSAAVAPSAPATPEVENIAFPDQEDLEYPDIGMGNEDYELDEEDDDLLPSDDDLEYPDMEMSPPADLPPPPEELSSSEMIEDDIEEDEEEIYGDEEEDDIEDGDEVEAELSRRKKKRESYLQQLKSRQEVEFEEEEELEFDNASLNKKKRNDRYLFILIVVLVVLISFVLYLYYRLFNTPFPLVGINSVHAQTITATQSLSKKKAYLSWTRS